MGEVPCPHEDDKKITKPEVARVEITAPGAVDLRQTMKQKEVETAKTPELREAELQIGSEVALSKYAFQEEDREHYEQVAGKISSELLEMAESSGIEIPVESLREIKTTLDSIAAKEGFQQLTFSDDVIEIIRDHEGSEAELYHKLAEIARPFKERGQKKPPTEDGIKDLLPLLSQLAGLRNQEGATESLFQYNHLMKGLVEAHWNPGEGRERKEMRIDNMGEVLDGIIETIVAEKLEGGAITEATAITAQDVLEIFRASGMKVPANWGKASVEYKRDIWFAMHSVARKYLEAATVFETDQGPIISIAMDKK